MEDNTEATPQPEPEQPEAAAKADFRIDRFTSKPGELIITPPPDVKNESDEGEARKEP